MQTPVSHLLSAVAMEQLPALCRAHRVRRLDVFGSAVTDTFDDARSDIDLLVDFEDLPLAGQVDLYFGLHDALRALFGRDVDLLTERSIENPYLRRSIEATRKPLYASP